MNNVLSSMQRLKSSKDCDKFSKSVSYETLVGGTTTTGREYVQNQRLSEGSAVKPLDAVGTLTSLQRNSAKVVEKLLQTFRAFKGAGESRKKYMRVWKRLIRRSLEKFFKKNFRDDSFVFAEAKKGDGSYFSTPEVLALTLILSIFTTTGEARAECPAGQVVGVSTHTCIDASGTCGDNCTYTIDASGLVTIFGSGKMNYSYTNGNYYDPHGNLAFGEKYKGDLISVVFDKDSNITEIGYGAFISASKLNSISIPETVISLGVNAFNHAESLENLTLPDSVVSIGSGAFVNTKLANIVLPDSVTSIGNHTFLRDNDLVSVTLSDSITSIGFSAFGDDFEQIKNLKLICRGSESSCQNLKNKLSRYCPDYYGCTEDEYIDLSERFSVAGYAECASTNYFWDGDSCVREPDVTKRKCCDSCKDMGGWCNRIRYTPAEAAEVLKDDNTNEITITFKK